MTPSLETQELLSTNYSLNTESQRIAEAVLCGMEILRGDDHTLVFDLDSEDAYKTFMERSEFLRSKLAMMRLIVTKSQSGNYHAVAYLDPLFPKISPQHALAIQACMGSDWKKEMLGVMRDLNYQQANSLLFRPQVPEVIFRWQRDSPSILTEKDAPF